MAEITVTQSNENSNAAQITDAGTPGGTPAAPAMPEGGFDKYWNAKDGTYNWEGHAKELAWQLSRKPATKPDTAPAPAGSKPGTQPDQAQIEAATSAAGVNIDAINAAIVNGEDIPAEDRAKLNAIGLPDDLIDSVVESQRAIAQEHVNNVVSFVGGKQGLAKLAEFVTKNYKPAEVEAFNAQLNDPNAWRAAATYLLHQAGLPQGNQGTIFQGPNAAGAATTVGAYQSDAEFQSDLRNPKYRTDAAFRKSVENRLRASPHLIGSSAKGHTGGL